MFSLLFFPSSFFASIGCCTTCSCSACGETGSVGGVIQCTPTLHPTQKCFECNVCKRNPSKKKETQNPEEVRREHGVEEKMLYCRPFETGLSLSGTRIGLSLALCH